MDTPLSAVSTLKQEQAGLSPGRAAVAGGLASGLLLVGVPLVSVLLLVLLQDRLPGHFMRNSAGQAVLMALAIGSFVLGGAAWGLAMRWLCGRGGFWRCVVSGGAGFAGLALGSAFLLAVLEGLFVEERIWPQASMAMIFGLLFTPAAALITGGSALLVGSAFGSFKQAARTALLCGLVGAAAFLVVDIVFHQFGMVVGGPRAADRATMIVVMFSGFFGSALSAGALFGWRLRSASFHQ